MIKRILKGILKALSGVVTGLLTPVNSLFNNLFPNMSNAIATFNRFVTTFFGDTLVYFFSILPPMFRSLLLLWFTFVVGYYGIYYAYLGFLKLFNVIQKVKFW